MNHIYFCQQLFSQDYQNIKRLGNKIFQNKASQTSWTFLLVKINLLTIKITYFLSTQSFAIILMSLFCCTIWSKRCNTIINVISKEIFWMQIRCTPQTTPSPESPHSPAHFPVAPPWNAEALEKYVPQQTLLLRDCFLASQLIYRSLSPTHRVSSFLQVRGGKTPNCGTAPK